MTPSIHPSFVLAEPLSTRECACGRVLSIAALAVAAVAPAFAHSAVDLSSPPLILAHPDVLPIAVVLGAGVLTWLLGNRRPRLMPAPARKPQPKDRRTRER